MNASKKRRKSILGSASSKISPAAELIANNVDLLTEILLRFPAKTLIRFKSVSKHWLSLISDSHFAARHSRQNPRLSVSGLFLCWNYWTETPKSVSLQGDPTLLTLDFLNGLGLVKIIHSCNGLLLCNYREFDSNFFTDVHYLVCNPTTQTYSLVPEPDDVVFSFRRVRRRMPFVFLAFDPLKSPHYKVVFMGLCLHVRIDIYCSESASWKQILAPGEGFRHEVFSGGVIHWLSDGDVVLGFDVESEKMIEMPNLPEIHSVRKIKYFGECGGRLILIQSLTPSNEYDVALNIFEMDKDFCFWMVKFQVDLGPLLSGFPEMESITGYYSVLCVVKGEKEKDFGLVLAIRGKVISYNLNCKTWKVLRDMAPGESISCSYPYATSYPFIESLSPL